MNTNEQAPECCPFCEAEKRGFSGKTTLYECNSFVSGYKPYSKQSAMCEHSVATSERERLTRERDEAKALAARRGEVLEKLVSKASASLASAGIQEGELGDRIEWVCAIKKQLEAEWSGWEPLQKEWFGDKYAAMQPWDAVCARIEDSEARVKRLEEAGDAMGADDQCHPHLMEQWEKAKEATP